MKLCQTHFADNQWKDILTRPGFDPLGAQLVLSFGHPDLVTDPSLFSDIRNRYPHAHILSCSTSGEILGERVHDHSLSVTAMQFEKTAIRCNMINIREHPCSYQAGQFLFQSLYTPDCCAILVLSDGTHINGSDLVAGLNRENHAAIPITGGLAGDGANFIQTFVGLDRLPEGGMVAAIGFYGAHLRIGHGSVGGWDEFGPERLITRSEKNILYEIDGKNALDLYKEYLGPYKEELPGSALFFPLAIREAGSNTRLVRTILNIDEHEKSMIFAGNIPQGSRVRLMKASFDRLIEGSATAAAHSLQDHSIPDPGTREYIPSAQLPGDHGAPGTSMPGAPGLPVPDLVPSVSLVPDLLPGPVPDLALLISCVGRKLILQDRTEEEVQSAMDIFGGHTPFAGFYSYGELSPFHRNGRCELHNQTMTITTFSES